MNAQAANPQDAVSPFSKPEPKVERQRRMLSHPQFFKLCEYLKQNHKALFAEPTTMTALANEATVFLQFPVSASAIGQALDATDLRKKAKLPNAKAGRGRNSEPQVTREEFLQLVRVVRSLVHHPDLTAVTSVGTRIWLDQLSTESD